MNNNKKMTHTIEMVGCDRRTREGFKQTMDCRLTKTMIVCYWGMRFNRKTGYLVAEEWPRYQVLLDTLKPKEG